MNFTIERAAFLTAAKSAAQLVPSASPLEVLKCVLLEIDTGTRSLHMTATNMEVTLRQDVPLLAYEGGDTTFAIDAKLLSAMLTNLPGNTVECCKGDKDTLALSSDHAIGFAMTLKDGRKIACCGDEPYCDAEYEYVKGSTLMLHEAFCLYSQRDIFEPYKKNHSTVKDACELAEQLGVPNLVLYHTEDKSIENRKALYTEEGRQYYHGSLIVPDDLETLEL